MHFFSIALAHGLIIEPYGSPSTITLILFITENGKIIANNDIMMVDYL